MTRLKDRRLNLLEYIYHRLFFPMANVAFDRSSSFGKVAVTNIEGYRQRIENDRLITSDAVYREVL
jgi:hypothetical protein